MLPRVARKMRHACQREADFNIPAACRDAQRKDMRRQRRGRLPASIPRPALMMPRACHAQMRAARACAHQSAMRAAVLRRGGALFMRETVRACRRAAIAGKMRRSPQRDAVQRLCSAAAAAIFSREFQCYFISPSATFQQPCGNMRFFARLLPVIPCLMQTCSSAACSADEPCVPRQMPRVERAQLRRCAMR